MNHFDYVILTGEGGVTGFTIADFYMKGRRIGDSGHGLIITQSVKKDKEGATTKGVKTVNQITPKLPYISRNNIEVYEKTLDLAKNSEARLSQLFEGTDAYLDNSKMGIRYCRNADEVEILESVYKTGNTISQTIVSEINDFIKSNVCHQCNADNLFFYKERVWNVSGYMERLIAKIPTICSHQCNNITVVDACTKLTLEIENIDGQKKTITTDKLIVCLGLGNIDFENSIQRMIDYKMEDIFTFRILPFYKSIYSGQSPIPPTISSIFMPGHNVCVTNEQNSNHGVLYNTNNRAVTINQWEEMLVRDRIVENRELLNQQLALDTSKLLKEFICDMTIDSTAFNSPEKHFEFVMSKSCIPQIHYVNLPYFTSIGSAINNLPKKIIDFGYGYNR